MGKIPKQKNINLLKQSGVLHVKLTGSMCKILYTGSAFIEISDLYHEKRNTCNN